MIKFITSLILLLITSDVFAQNTFSITMDEYLNGPAIVVPKGNHNNAQKDYKDGKYQNVLSIISQPENVCIIKQAAQLYEIDPVSIMSSIIGEHTFNVNAWDIAQENYIYMVKKWIGRFEDNGIDLGEMLKEVPYNSCPTTTDNNYDLWDCYNSIWKNDSRNYRRDSSTWTLKWTFFNPMGAGYTYGFGQLGPERALMLTDIVHSVSKFDLLNIDNPEAIYDAILNPQISIHYVAASNRIAIDLYKRIANFDISQNMGIIATLYNLGNEYNKAEALYQKTVKSLRKKDEANYPEVNYYGWFINSKEDEIRAVYNKSIEKSKCP